MSAVLSERELVWRRRGYAAAAALALHALLIYGAGLVAPQLNPRWLPAPDIQVDLVRAPELIFAPHAKSHADAKNGERPALARLRPHRVPKEQLKQAPPTLIAPLAPPSPALPAPPAVVEAETGAGDLRGALRAAIGCAHQDYLNLSAAERARCDHELATGQAAIPVIDRIPGEKRARFSQQALDDERRRAAREAVIPQPIVQCDGPGSNLGLGCIAPK